MLGFGFFFFFGILGICSLFPGGAPELTLLFSILGFNVLPLAALVLLAFRRTRMFALGVLIGALVAVMILLAICFISPPNFH